MNRKKKMGLKKKKKEGQSKICIRSIYHIITPSQ